MSGVWNKLQTRALSPKWAGCLPGSPRSTLPWAVISCLSLWLTPEAQQEDWPQTPISLCPLTFLLETLRWFLLVKRMKSDTYHVIEALWNLTPTDMWKRIFCHDPSFLAPPSAYAQTDRSSCHSWNVLFHSYSLFLLFVDPKCTTRHGRLKSKLYHKWYYFPS